MYGCLENGSWNGEVYYCEFRNILKIEITSPRALSLFTKGSKDEVGKSGMYAFKFYNFIDTHAV